VPAIVGKNSNGTGCRMQ